MTIKNRDVVPFCDFSFVSTYYSSFQLRRDEALGAVCAELGIGCKPGLNSSWSSHSVLIYYERGPSTDGRARFHHHLGPRYLSGKSSDLDQLLHSGWICPDPNHVSDTCLLVSLFLPFCIESRDYESSCINISFIAVANTGTYIWSVPKDTCGVGSFSIATQVQRPVTFSKIFTITGGACEQTTQSVYQTTVACTTFSSSAPQPTGSNRFINKNAWIYPVVGKSVTIQWNPSSDPATVSLQLTFHGYVPNDSNSIWITSKSSPLLERCFFL